jgi:hypothetical protein
MPIRINRSVIGWIALAVLNCAVIMPWLSKACRPPFASALLLFPLRYYVTHSESFYRHPIEPIVGLLVAYACLALVGFGRGAVKVRSIARKP